MEIVDQGAPPGIVGAVHADESGQARPLDGQLDQLIGRRTIEPLAPHSQPLSGQVSVEERILEGAAVVLAPAPRVEIRDVRRVG